MEEEVAILRKKVHCLNVMQSVGMQKNYSIHKINIKMIMILLTLKINLNNTTIDKIG